MLLELGAIAWCSDVPIPPRSSQLFLNSPNAPEGAKQMELPLPVYNSEPG